MKTLFSTLFVAAAALMISCGGANKPAEAVEGEEITRSADACTDADCTCPADGCECGESGCACENCGEGAEASAEAAAETSAE